VQAEVAAVALRQAGREIAFLPITTAGDRDRKSPFGQIGERGVFVKEIEEALLAGRIDVAVHSAKDMTSTDTAGLVVGAYLAREDPRDALCGAPELRPGMRIGTNGLWSHCMNARPARIRNGPMMNTVKMVVDQPTSWMPRKLAQVQAAMTPTMKTPLRRATVSGENKRNCVSSSSTYSAANTT